MKLDAKALGLTLGILCGVVMLLATFWVMLRGGGEHLVMLKRFFLGYSISVQGAFVGAAWGFVEGFVSGWLLASLYNRLARS